MKRILFACLAVACLLAPSPCLAEGPSADGQKILGKAPVKYGTGKKVRRTHNEAAIVTRIWTPGLDEKFVPQERAQWEARFDRMDAFILNNESHHEQK